MKAHPNHVVWGEIQPELKPSDFDHPHDMDVTALRRLSRIRRAAGVPFRVVSDARSGGVGVSNSAHDERPCTAVDLQMRSSRERFLVLRAAIYEGCERIGIYMPTAYQKQMWGKNAGSLHLDFSQRLPAEVCWVDF